MVGTASCLIGPGCVRQVNGVGATVAGIGLGGTVTIAVAVEVEGITIWVGIISLDGKQAESPARSEI